MFFIHYTTSQESVKFKELAVRTMSLLKFWGLYRVVAPSQCGPLLTGFHANFKKTLQHNTQTFLT